MNETANKPQEVKPPPIGIIPEKIWKEQRYIDLMNAIQRYVDDNRPIPREWVYELTNFLSNKL